MTYFKHHIHLFTNFFFLFSFNKALYSSQNLCFTVVIFPAHYSSRVLYLWLFLLHHLYCSFTDFSLSIISAYNSFPKPKFHHLSLVYPPRKIISFLFSLLFHTNSFSYLVSIKHYIARKIFDLLS